MNYDVVIAEKGNMGKDIAKALSAMLGKPITGGGLVEYVGNYAITAASGHLFELQEPEAYGSQFDFPWRIDVLPFMPERFKWELKRKKIPGKGSGPVDPHVKNRYEEICRQLRNARSVIHAGDPGREGQLIVDLILREAGWRGPTKRLWLNAQTEGGIIEAFGRLKSNDDMGKIFLEAECRAEADWVIGINGTRVYTKLWWEKGHKGVVNVGRVVTSLVGMIVARENEINNFVPTDHYSLSAVITLQGKQPFKAAWVRPEGIEGMDPTGKMLLDSNVTKAIAQRCNKKLATIISAEKTPKSAPPPLLLSLLDLQKLGGGLGYSPAEVLAAAQELYDKYKLTSYPRTESQYAPESEFLNAKAVLNTVKANFGEQWDFSHDVVVSRKSRSFNDSKLDEHFAIIPLATKVAIGTLAKREADIYRLIVRQYIAQFCSNYESLSTVILAQVEDQKFKATGSIPTNMGWKNLFGGNKAASKQKDDDSTQDNLPEVSAGEKGMADPVSVVANKTEPPVRYTSITILDAMKDAWKLVTDPTIKARLKQIEGLGTAATRAGTVEKAETVEFIVGQKVKGVITYAPTQKAYSLVASVPALLSKPDLTAYFEGKLESIKNGEIGRKEFREILGKMLNIVVGPGLDPTKRAMILSNMPRPEDMVKPVFATSRKPRAGATRKRASSK